MLHRATRSVRILFVIVLTVLLALPAFGEEPVCYQTAVDADGNPTGPVFCTQQVWFTDTGAKAGNLGAVGATDFPSWDTTAPDKSVTAGAGGGYFSNGVNRQLASDPQRDAAMGATFEGTFTGDLDNMLIEMYLFAPVTQAADPPGAYVGSIELDVDGKQVLFPTQTQLQLVSGGNAVQKTTLAITNLQKGLVAAGVETGPDVEHNLRFLFSAYGLVSATSVIVYDTTEVPGGITFNAAEIGTEVPIFPAG